MEAVGYSDEYRHADGFTDYIYYTSILYKYITIEHINQRASKLLSLALMEILFFSSNLKSE